MKGTSRKVWAWALYDWANSAFAVIVMAGFFPVFFKQYWSGDVENNVSTFRLGMANSLSGLVVVLLTSFRSHCGSGQHASALSPAFRPYGFDNDGLLTPGRTRRMGTGNLVYTAATVSFSMANTFYDSLLSDVAPPKELTPFQVWGTGWAT